MLSFCNGPGSNSSALECSPLLLEMEVSQVLEVAVSEPGSGEGERGIARVVFPVRAIGTLK